MDLTLNVWRQAGPGEPGKMVEYRVQGVSEHSSFLEMLDVLNQQLGDRGEEPIAFDHDCREGICGSCGFLINGIAHGPMPGTTVCQLHMRHFKSGDTLRLEPWRIVEAGGFVSVGTGSAPEANLIPVPKPLADRAFDAAACIGCGACVAQCPNGAAQLFTAAKVSHLGLLPQGQPERAARAVAMVEAMETQGFGACSNYAECEGVCPKEISIDFIARMNRDYLKAKMKGVAKVPLSGGD
jgi:succinate dehydrogenase iron-sulfur subunit